MVFESFTHTPNKTIHICEVPEYHEGNLVFEVGRSSDVDVRITGNYNILKHIIDISVSRIHSKITFHKG